MDNALRQAFNERMFGIMTRELYALPFEALIEMHNELCDEYEKTEASGQEAPVSFALTAVKEAIKQKRAAMALN